MMNKITTAVMAVCFGASMASGFAQSSTGAVIVEGERATLYFIAGAPGASTAMPSLDGRYLGGAYPFTESGVPGTGYVYDFEKDSTWQTEVAANFLISPNHYASQGGFIWRDGEVLNVETLSPSPSESMYGMVSLWAATAGGDTLFSMSYEYEENPNTGEMQYNNYAYLIDSKTGEILSRVEPHWPMSPDDLNIMYGERVNAVNADGTILVGHSCWPGSGSNWSPVLWDLANDTSFYVGGEEDAFGTLLSVNAAGTIFGSYQTNIVYYYDRENMRVTSETMPFAPGCISGNVRAISDDGLVLVYQSNVNYTGQLYAYDTHTKELTPFSTFVEELYGLESPATYGSALYISGTGRMMCGYTTYQGNTVPYCLMLDEHQILPRPRSFSALQQPGSSAVVMNWQAPLQGQYTVLGYNVFCDSVQINAEMIPVGESDYVQVEGIQSGLHEYAVQAVYAEGVSAYSEPVRLMIVEDGGCFPVQEMGSSVLYNRYVDVWWNLPSSQMAAKQDAPKAWDGTLRAVDKASGEAGGHAVNPAKSSYANASLDLINYEAFDSYDYSSAVVAGSRLYASSYSTGYLYEFNRTDMTLARTIPVSGASVITNMVYLDGRLYLATLENGISVMNLNTMTLANRLNTEAGVEVRHLSYIPDLDEGQGGFAYGDWNSLYFCNRYGQTIDPGVDIDISGLNISGTAYHDGILYLFSQSGSSLGELYALDFATGQYVSMKDLGTDPRLGAIEPQNGFVAGGLSLNLLPDSTVALGALLQFTSTNSHVAFLEVEGAPGLLGYNLYRNGVKLNADGEYIQGLSYKDTLMDAGTYVYTVEPVHEDGCTNQMEGVQAEVTITPIGECSAPAGLSGRESYSSVLLDWDYEATTGPALVGFNIYRDGELLERSLQDFEYEDMNMPKGEYVYKVEAFHDNSCVAADSVTVAVTMEGTMMPPSHLSLETSKVGDNSYNVDMEWDLPYFEEPLAVGYCGSPYTGTSFTDTGAIWCLVGWDAAGLDPYRDLYIVGMEYYIGEGITSVTGLVYVNDTLALEVPSPSRVRENSWNTLMFGEYISMDQPMEALVGYRVTYEDPSVPVVIFDAGPGLAGYGDLISSDGSYWTTLATNNVSANWCINALVANKRDMEALAKSGSGHVSVPLVKTMGLGKVGLSEPKAVQDSKATSDNVKLLGFNAYRDGEKLNPETLSTLSYTDHSVSEGSYEYYASAVYADGEVEGESILIDVDDMANEAGTGAFSLKVGPNPASEQVWVEGMYRSLDILTLTGQKVASHAGGTACIPVSGLASGAYMLKFILPDGSVEIHKLIVRR